MSYLDYTKYCKEYWESLAWELIKKHLFHKYNEKCCHCGEEDISKLVIHHITYQNFPFEKEEDMIVLCKKCHNEIHKKDSKKVYTEHTHLKNIMTSKEDKIMDLKKISKDVQEKFSKCCDLCDENPTQGQIFFLKEINLYYKKTIQNAFTNLYTHPNRKEISIYPECFEKLRLTRPGLWDIEKNPQLAKALASNPKERLKILHKQGEVDLNVKGGDENGDENESQETL